MITNKLCDFLKQQTYKTPFLVVDLDKVKENYYCIREHLSLAKCYYSVKSNSSPDVLKMLKEQNSCFEAASIREVQACLAVGVSAENIHFGNTIKTAANINKAFELGIRSYSFDCYEELSKIADNAPGSAVICRIENDGVGATWGLCNKFGCSIEQTIELLSAAKSLNFSNVGVSFHVGSQQKSPLAWKRALSDVKMVADALAIQGVKLNIVNLGGGFPASGYLDSVDQSIDYSLKEYGEAITDHIETIFPNHKDIIFMCEPGRYLLAEAGCIKSQVVLASDRSPTKQDGRWLYLDVGKYNGLYEATDVKLPIIYANNHTTELVPTFLAGPTCDSDDMLSVNNDYHKLPADITTGDFLIFASTGAYSNSYASVGFNGFLPLTEFYI